MNSALVKPAGHTPQPSRQIAQSEGLVELCMEWFERVEELETDPRYDKYEHFERYMQPIICKFVLTSRRSQYECALDVLRGDPMDHRRYWTKHSPTVDEAHALLLDPRIREHERWSDMGMFVSAIYNTCGQKTIIYEGDTPTIDAIGLYFDGIFVNKGNVGEEFGRQASGIFVNHGTAGRDVGTYATGIFINTGRTRSLFGGTEPGASIVINAGHAGSIVPWYTSECIRIHSGTGEAELLEPDSSGRTRRDDFHAGPIVLLGQATQQEVPDYVLNEETALPELKSYVATITDCARSEPEKMMMKFGNTDKIQTDIRALVKRSFEARK